MNGKLLSALGRAKSIEESVLHPDWRRDSHVIKYWLLIGQLRDNEHLWGKLEADLSQVSTVNIHVLFRLERKKRSFCVINDSVTRVGDRVSFNQIKSGKSEEGFPVFFCDTMPSYYNDCLGIINHQPINLYAVENDLL